jgi:hypothetical protein
MVILVPVYVSADDLGARAGTSLRASAAWVEGEAVGLGLHGGADDVTVHGALQLMRPRVQPTARLYTRGTCIPM